MSNKLLCIHSSSLLNHALSFQTKTALRFAFSGLFNFPIIARFVPSAIIVYVCRERLFLVKNHKPFLQLNSLNYDSGTTYTFRIPLRFSFSGLFAFRLSQDLCLPRSRSPLRGSSPLQVRNNPTYVVSSIARHRREVSDTNHSLKMVSNSSHGIGNV
jgi:hypothetical protein